MVVTLDLDVIGVTSLSNVYVFMAEVNVALSLLDSKGLFV